MTRRIIAFVLCILSLCSCSMPSSVLEKHSAVSVDVFDTYIEVTAYTKTKEEFNSFFFEVTALLNTLAEEFDIYNDYEGINNIKTVNDNAGLEPVTVSENILELLEFGMKAYDETHGTVNIALGSLLSVWHKYREEGIENPSFAMLPAMEELTEASKHTDISLCKVNRKESTVFLLEPGMSLDVGAISKGYAANRLATLARERGLSCLIDFGGNVITVGKPEDGKRKAFNIGVADPLGKPDYFDILTLKDLSAVTSGDYQRYYVVDSVMYHHIIDPVTLMPAARYAAVTIIHKDSAVADMLSTALFILPEAEGMGLAERFNAGSVYIYKDGSYKANETYKSYSQKRR